jgi:hypothetical protein
MLGLQVEMEEADLNRPGGDHGYEVEELARGPSTAPDERVGANDRASSAIRPAVRGRPA